MATNVELVQGAYAAFGRADVGAIVDLVDDAVRWSSPATLPQGGEYQGKDGVLAFFVAIGEAWDPLQVEVSAVGELGDGRVVGIVHGSGTLRSGGAAQYGAAHLFTVRDDKVIEFHEYVDVGPAAVS
jgi:ketosteroid isomerase-like protein